MVVHFVRALFLVVVLSLTISFATYLAHVGEEAITLYMVIPAVLAVAVILVDMFWRHKPLQMLSGLFFGVLAGLVISYVFSVIIDMAVTFLMPVATIPDPGQPPREPSKAMATSSDPNMREAYVKAKAAYASERGNWEDAEAKYMSAVLAPRKAVQLIKLLVGAAVVFLCVSFVLQTKDDFRFVIPYVQFAKETKGARPMLLDTSVIIDGRVADIAETGILESEVLVPRFILSELQGIADSEDKLKRNRGRRGLDILNRLQGCKKLEIRIVDPHVAEVDASPDVDGKLLNLAKHLGARMVTNDYNLNKVAKLRAVDVININDLANALKPIVLPGERMTVRIVKPGEESGQGVGYLADGTMVVAEGGREAIGREISISVTSVLQTSAGRMIFGRSEAERSVAAPVRRT
jgi:uncharacterized protein YacL